MSRGEQRKLSLDRGVFIGRTYEEYLDIFSLSEKELRGKAILDCPAGACSFAAIGSKKGLNITACDIVFEHRGYDLKQKGLTDIEHAMAHVEKAKNQYVWNYFKDVDELKAARISALEECTNGMEAFPERFIPVTLPTLPFKENQFDLVLSAHFLFSYSDRLDEHFHLTTLNELLRVAKDEIRLFPLVDLHGKRYEPLDKIINTLQKKGHAIKEVESSYEFQKGANTMLVIQKSIA